ncbi:MAG: peptidoglycan-binding protein, partial [Thermodesulfobacteriota bacterium]
MSFTKSNSIAFKIAIGVMGVAFAFALLFGSVTQAQAALTTSQVDAIISLLESFGADAATINNVRVSLAGGTPTTTGGGSSASVCPFTWSTSLTSGSSGADVKALQQFLNADSDTQIASSGVGSAGSETDFFGSLTKAAVIKFQDKYASDVLTPVGLSAGTGYFGSSSRAKANALCSTAPTTTTDDTTTTD